MSLIPIDLHENDRQTLPGEAWDPSGESLRALVQSTLAPQPPHADGGMCPRPLTDVEFALIVDDCGRDRWVCESELAGRSELAPDPAGSVMGRFTLVGPDDTLLGCGDALRLPEFAASLRRTLDQLTTFGAPGRVRIPGHAIFLHMELLADLTVLSLVRAAGRPYARRAYVTLHFTEAFADAIARLELYLRSRGLLIAANVIRGETTTPRRLTGSQRRVKR